jgi:hypothetical protein
VVSKDAQDCNSTWLPGKDTNTTDCNSTWLPGKQSTEFLFVVFSLVDVLAELGRKRKGAI